VSGGMIASGGILNGDGLSAYNIIIKKQNIFHDVFFIFLP